MLSKLAAMGAGRSAARGATRQRGMAVRGLAYKAPMREMQFLLHEVHDSGKHYAKLTKSGGANATPDTVQMIIDESAKFAENELAPINEGADRVGCKQTGPNTVITPPGFKAAYEQFVAGGWQGLTFPEKWGGQGMPNSLALIQSEMTATANWTWTMYPGLSKGAINTLLAHGSEPLQKKFLPKLVTGEWTGTMCLTEPHCGSDLAQVSTKAVPIAGEPGKYAISGTKIFISCGEHDFTDNIVHCVLARLPDAPPGIKGISLFAVPKVKVDESGALLPGQLNKATVGRIEHKMGCHGSSTCELNFDGAVGELIGTAHKGMSHMFTFINTSRMGTAIQGLAAAEGSYQNALWYAKERGAMRSLTGTKEPGKPADPIIVHPAVRAMLLTQKCIAEGGRAMIYDCAMLGDYMAEAEANGDHDKAKKIDDRLGFLTPILKGFLTEMGNEAAKHGIQVYGGHGYVASNHQEQIARDVRISSVWEGTTQIQALDLLGRKIMLQKLRPINEHLAGIRKLALANITSPATTAHGELRKHGLQLLGAALHWHYLTLRVAAKSASNKDCIGIASEPYLMLAGYVGLAEQWLKMEAVAAKALAKNPSGPDADFYKGKILASKFYFENMLPRTSSLAPCILADPDSLMKITPAQFAHVN